MELVRNYQGRVAVITGAGSGLGQALATEFAARNCNLALVDVDSSVIAQTKTELTRPGIVVTDHCVDVGCERNLELVARDVENIHGAIHLLINNAGVSASSTPKAGPRHCMCGLRMLVPRGELHGSARPAFS
ncbi:SDR family NAD(P)-dependent oxidoreductase [Acidicapsa dinghuensis]|uniref:SDR family NAD(P)-dependent oxidoreductase n=1 Tax=Acidicapsa dinghuensis TaxID=2218256 RepID=A0ABW1EE32_9BACT